MKAGRLYNANSKDLEKYHLFGMETCDKFNRTPLWMKKRKQRLLEKLIPSAKFWLLFRGKLVTKEPMV